MLIDYPFHIDARGRTADTNMNNHIRDLIEQVLFTAPGERVNRPEFGSGLQKLVFAPANNELATATRFVAQGALQQWLGDLIDIESVSVKAIDAGIEVKVVYKIKNSNQRQVATIQKEVT
jgi:phage baseplate assembly protein W